MTSIIIPCYLINNELEELTVNCICSFRRTSTDYKIIIVDDASPQGQEILKKEADIYIRNEKNLGFAATVNTGWEKAKELGAKYIVTSNNDLEVYPKWQEIFIETLENFNGDLISGLGYKSRIVEGRPLEQYLVNPGSKANSNCVSFGGQFDDWMFSGALFLMKAKVLDKIGYFDENFSHGGYEDLDYFYRAKLAGLKLIITPKVAYWHKEGTTRFLGQEKEKQNIAEKHNLEYFIKKHKFNPHQNLNKIFEDIRFNY